MDARLAGAAGEYYAARFYRDNGYAILTANYRTRLGELDLVVCKKKLVAVAEVKLRRPGAKVSGREAVDIHKQRRIIAAAQEYLQHAGLLDCIIRFDVIEVEIQQGSATVTPIFGAFDEN